MAPGEADPEPESLFPMAFLVEQDPGKVVKPHFHQADQFQVVVGGEARMGTHDVTGIAVHYTNRYSAYGPIVATEKGVNYFTLRNGWDPGARYMPEQRLVLKEKRKEPHREAVAEPEPMALKPEPMVAVVPVRRLLVLTPMLRCRRWRLRCLRLSRAWAARKPLASTSVLRWICLSSRFRALVLRATRVRRDRKSTRLNSSHT